MITNHDIEIAFVQAQNRINEKLADAQLQFMLPDMENIRDAIQYQMKKGRPKQVNENNPIANEEI